VKDGVRRANSGLNLDQLKQDETIGIGYGVERRADRRVVGRRRGPRLTLTVDATGNPRIEFLDDKGLVTQRLPPGK
jgi:hypothetical protein